MTEKPKAIETTDGVRELMYPVAEMDVFLKEQAEKLENMSSVPSNPYDFEIITLRKDIKDIAVALRGGKKEGEVKLK